MAEKPATSVSHVDDTDHPDVQTKGGGVGDPALAIATSLQKPSLWSKSMLKLYGCIAVAMLNSCINGYDGSLMGSINSYAQYRDYFGFDPNSGTPSTGIVYAIYTIGNIV
ncbi:hypothetical protein AbraIFM66950_006800, partial [Aspergillus brasiliensis]